MVNYIAKIFGASPVAPLQEHMEICYKAANELINRAQYDAAESLLTRDASLAAYVGGSPASNYADFYQMHVGPGSLISLANVYRRKGQLTKMDEMLINPNNISGMQVYEDYEKLKIRHDEALVSWEKQILLQEKMAGKRK